MQDSETKKAADAEKKADQDKVDEASKQSFPASDPARHSGSTSTESPTRPQDRQATVPSKEEIDAARRGEGHKHQGGS